MINAFYALPLTILSIMPKKRKLTRCKPDHTKEMIEKCLLAIATHMELLKANNSRKLPYYYDHDALTKAINEMKGILPWLMVVKVKYYLTKQDKLQFQADVASVPNPSSHQHTESQTSAISDLTKDGGFNVKLSNQYESFSYIDETLYLV